MSTHKPFYHYAGLQPHIFLLNNRFLRKFTSAVSYSEPVSYGNNSFYDSWKVTKLPHETESKVILAQLEKWK